MSVTLGDGICWENLGVARTPSSARARALPIDVMVKNNSRCQGRRSYGAGYILTYGRNRYTCKRTGEASVTWSSEVLEAIQTHG